ATWPNPFAVQHETRACRQRVGSRHAQKPAKSHSTLSGRTTRFAGFSQLGADARRGRGPPHTQKVTSSIPVAPNDKRIPNQTTNRRPRIKPSSTGTQDTSLNRTEV